MRHRRLWLVAVIALTTVLVGLPAGAEAPPILTEITESTVLDADHYGSVVVATPNVILDCAGHSIIGPGFEIGEGEDIEELGGITVEPFSALGVAVENVTIKNCNVVNHVGGVGVGANYTTLKNNTVDGSERGFGGFGIFSNHNVIQNNTATNVAWDGFLLRGDELGDPVEGNLLRGNHAENNVSNFSLEFADNNILVDNLAVGDGAVGLGFQVAFSSGNLLEGNAATGVEVGFALSDAENNALEGNSASGFSAGFESWNSHLNRFTGNVVSEAIFGFFFDGSTGNKIEGNSFTEPHEVESTGVFLSSGSDSNIVEDNYMKGLTVGISLEGSSLNRVEGNTVLRSVENGFNLLEADGNVIEDNQSRHNIGDGFNINSSSSNVFEGNTANTNGIYGFLDDQAYDNTYSDNTCRGNKEGASDPEGLC